MSEDDRTISSARVVELEMQIVTCREVKRRVTELEAQLRSYRVQHDSWAVGGENGVGCHCDRCIPTRRLLGEQTT